MQIVYDLIDPQELVGFVRTLQFPDFRLNEILPDQNIRDIEYRFLRGNFADQEAAQFRSWDTEAPIADRQGIVRVSGELPPVSRKIRLGEYERLRREALERQNQDDLVEAVYNDAANMTRAVHARMEVARGQALYTGKVTINENGLQAEVDFGYDATHKPTAAVSWALPATMKPLDDLLAWFTVLNDDAGVDPNEYVVLTSRKNVNRALSSDQLRNLAKNQGVQPDSITRSTLNNVLGSYDLPPIMTNDEVVNVGGVSTRVIPDDKLLLVPRNPGALGRTFWGITAEALELRSEGQIASEDTPGVVAVVQKTFDPVAVWTKAAGIGIPIVANPTLILVADVIP